MHEISGITNNVGSATLSVDSH